MRKKLTILFLALFIPVLAFAFTYEWVIDDMEYANDAAAQTAYESSDTTPSAKATGGTITYDGNYVVHTFLSDGTFTPLQAFDVEYLVIAGGGGGGSNHGAGGGAGGFLTDTGHGVTAKAYSITVGGGGAGGGTGSSGTVGEDSVFDTITSDGGGYGGGYGKDGGDGGSGGGGGGKLPYGDAGSATAGQGHDGGGTTTDYGGAGGGGAGVAGSVSGTQDAGGDGGNGTESSISGSSVTYAGGGGGNGYKADGGAGGTGGGGYGGQYGNGEYMGTVGEANTGGGGGGNFFSTYLQGMDGGSGIVIIKYLGQPHLQSYSESTIKTQGSYSLKGVAVITDSLNDTLTKTLTDYLDYSIMDKLIFQVRSSRTGENLQLQIHDTGGTTSSHTIDIAVADTWQTETWDISGITTTDRDTIDKIIVKVIEASAANTFYFDGMFSEAIIESSHVWIGG